MTRRSGRRVAVLHEILGAIDEVGERVQLLHHPALFPPFLAHLAAAADVCVGEDDAAIEQAQAIRRERRRSRRAVRAIRIEQERRLAIESDAFAVDDRDRDLRAVARVRPYAPRLVLRRIVATQDFLPLQQLLLTRRHVVVVDRRRGDHRLVVEAHRAGVELGVAGERNREVGLVGGNSRRLLRLRVDHSELRQPTLAFGHHDVVGKKRQAVDANRRIVIDEDAPVLLRRILHRCSDDLEVLGALVGRDVEDTAVVIDIVFVSRLTRQNHPGAGSGRVRRQVANFRGRLCIAGEKNRSACRAIGRRRDRRARPSPRTQGR